MKCDNKECDREAIYSAKNKKWDFQLNLCHLHLRDLIGNYGMEFEIVSKIL